MKRRWEINFLFAIRIFHLHKTEHQGVDTFDMYILFLLASTPRQFEQLFRFLSSNLYIPEKTRSLARIIALLRRTLTHKWIMRNIVMFITTLWTRSGSSYRFENLKGGKYRFN